MSTEAHCIHHTRADDSGIRPIRSSRTGETVAILGTFEPAHELPGSTPKRMDFVIVPSIKGLDLKKARILGALIRNLGREKSPSCAGAAMSIDPRTRHSCARLCPREGTLPSCEAQRAAQPDDCIERWGISSHLSWAVHRRTQNADVRRPWITTTPPACPHPIQAPEPA